MNKKAVVLYLTIIGLLLLGAIAWYIYSFLTEPKTIPASFELGHLYTEIALPVALGIPIAMNTYYHK